MQQGNYAEAAILAEQLYMDNDRVVGLIELLETELLAGNQERVYAIRDSLQRTGELEEQEQEDPIWAARFYIVMGEREMALSLLEKAQDSSPYSAARYYASLGEREKALDLLEKYYEDFPKELPVPTMEFYEIGAIIHSSDFDPLRAEPRFKAMLQKLRHTEVFDQNGQRIQ